MKFEILGKYKEKWVLLCFFFNRSNELEILDKIINIFETRFDKVDEYIRDLTF